MLVGGERIQPLSSLTVWKLRNRSLQVHYHRFRAVPVVVKRFKALGAYWSVAGQLGQYCDAWGGPGAAKRSTPGRPACWALAQALVCQDVSAPPRLIYFGPSLCLNPFNSSQWPSGKTPKSLARHPNPSTPGFRLHFGACGPCPAWRQVCEAKLLPLPAHPGEP